MTKNSLSKFTNPLKLISKYLKLKSLNADIIIGRGNPAKMVKMFMKIFRKKPFVYFPYDIRSQYAPTRKLLKEVRKLDDKEIDADKFCFENADGIIHKGSPKELEFVSGRSLGEVNLCNKQITFQPYASEEFVYDSEGKLSDKDGEIHTVFLASANKPSVEVYEFRLDEFRDIIKQKIHIHLYLSSNTDSLDEVEEFYEKNKDYPFIEYYHIHKGLDPKEIVKEVSKYDFGLLAHRLEPQDYDIEPFYFTGNKISTYLEAGLPIMLPKMVTYVNELMNNYGLKFNYPEDISELRDYFKSIDVKDSLKKIEIMREDFSMEKNIERLEKFLNDIILTRKINKE